MGGGDDRCASTGGGSHREGDIVARTGEDHFAVLLPKVTVDAVVAIGERMLRRMDAPVPVGASSVTARASVGAAVSQSVLGEELLQSALGAMEAVRRSGGGRVELVKVPE